MSRILPGVSCKGLAWDSGPINLTCQSEGAKPRLYSRRCRREMKPKCKAFQKSEGLQWQWRFLWHCMILAVPRQMTELCNIRAHDACNQL